MKHPPPLSSFLIAFFTTIVRYYDYALFGLSASVLAENFMPGSSEEHRLLNFFAVFSIAVLARPLGSVIFGIIGDSYGRAVSVKISACFAAGATILIGLIPDFDKIGALAMVLLMFCRMVFIMSLSGEADAIRIYVAEKASLGRKVIANGIVSACSQIGALIAAISYHFAMNSDYVYGWRINFIIGGLSGIVIILLRHFFQETAEFVNYQKTSSNKVSLGFIEAIKNYRRKFLLAMLISGCCGGTYHFLIIFFATFAARITGSITSNHSQIINMKLIALYGLVSIVSGFVGERGNLTKQMIISLIVNIFICLIAVYYFAGAEFISLLPLLVVVVPFYTVPAQIVIQSLFPVEIRMRMCSLSHSLGGLIFSSTIPFFGMLVWQYTAAIKGTIWVFITLQLIVLISVIMLKIK